MEVLTPALAPSANEGMIELKQCPGYTTCFGAHDRWHRGLPRQLDLNPHAPAVAARRGVDNSTQGTMCCAPLKLVPWVKRTRGSSDGGILIRDSQVFYHSVRLGPISFWGGMRSVQERILPHIRPLCCWSQGAWGIIGCFFITGKRGSSTFI